MKGLIAAGCALVTASCGYPEFHFDAPDDAATDSTIVDEGIDAGDASVDGSDADAKRDALVDSSVEVTADSSVDSPVDGVAETTGDSSVETIVDAIAESETAGDTTDPCALIDDLEDGDARIIVTCGRNGYWFTFDDGTAGASQTPAPSASCLPSLLPIGTPGDLYAMRTFGSGFTTWGAGVGFNFVNGGPSYDASKWGGVSFVARVETATVTSVRIDFPDVDTDARGGVCNTLTPGCGDHFGYPLTLSTTWTRYTIRFSDLVQLGWGHAAASFNATKAYGVQAQTAPSSKFDVWLDEVSFVP